MTRTELTSQPTPTPSWRDRVALSLPGAGQPFGIERQGDRGQAPAGRVSSKNLSNDVGLGRVNDPADPDSSPVPVPIGRSLVVQGLPSIAKSDPTSAEPLQGLPF